MNTQHYGFKLFESTDHPTWLTDWNTTITNIDNALYRIATGGGDLPDLSEVVARLQALEGRVDSDELRLNQLEGSVANILDELTSISADLTSIADRVTQNENDIAVLQNSVNTTIPSQISSINSLVSSLDTRVTALESSGGGDNMTHHFGKIANSLSTFNDDYAYQRIGKGKIIFNCESDSSNQYGYFSVFVDGVEITKSNGQENNITVSGGAPYSFLHQLLFFVKTPYAVGSTGSQLGGGSVFEIPYNTSIKIMVRSMSAGTLFNCYYDDIYEDNL